jgi:hypothetical protein
LSGDNRITRLSLVRKVRTDDLPDARDALVEAFHEKVEWR